MMQKNKLLLIGCQLIVALSCFGQKTNNEILKGSFSESNMRKYVYENMVFNDYEKRIKPLLSKNKGNILEIINKSIVLDSNEFFYVSFKEITDTNLVFSKDYTLIEFKTTVNHTVIQKSYTSNRPESVILPGFYELELAEKGIIAIDTKSNKLLFLSGYLILDDIKNDFFFNGLNKEAILKYTRLKYFNYDPYDIIIKGATIRFKSKKNPNGIIREHKLTLSKAKQGYIEKFD